MRRLMLLAGWVTVLCVLATAAQKPISPPLAKPDEAALIVERLVKSLTMEQRAKAVVDWEARPRATIGGLSTCPGLEGKDGKLRHFIRFLPGADRDGIRLMELTPEQVALVEKYIDATMSDYGARQARAMMDQDAQVKKSRKDYFVTIIGDTNKQYAFRLWEHHLTISSGNTDSPTEVLPNLLGGRGGWEPKVSWQPEEKIAVLLWNSLTDEQKKSFAVKATPNDQLPFPAEAKGDAIEKLDGHQQFLARRLLDERLRCYKPSMKAKVEAIIQAHGGLAKLNLVFTGDPSKTAAENGNRFAWRITGERFLCDYSSFPTLPGVKEDAHVHMTLMGAAPT